MPKLTGRRLLLSVTIIPIVALILGITCYPANADEAANKHSYAASISGHVGTSYAGGGLSKSSNASNYSGNSSPAGTSYAGGNGYNSQNYSGGGYSGNNSYSTASQGVPTRSYARTAGDLSSTQQHVNLGRSTSGSLLNIMHGSAGGVQQRTRDQALMGRLKINPSNRVPARASVSASSPFAQSNSQNFRPASTSSQNQLRNSSSPTNRTQASPANNAGGTPAQNGPSLLQQLRKRRN